jgi:hypothetical protein
MWEGKNSRKGEGNGKIEERKERKKGVTMIHKD